MAKLGWGLINKREDLWVKVLRAKYGCGSDVIPEVKRRQGDSNAWKGVCSGWNTVTKNLCWVVGNGKITKFWSDRWVRNTDALKNWAVGVNEMNLQNDLVCDWVDVNGRWRINELRQLLPDDICNRITAMKPPVDCCDDDKPAWALSVDGSFSVKSAYEDIMGWRQSSAEGVWKKIWKWPGPQRIKSFLWLLTKGRLFTNCMRLERGVCLDGTCSRCMRGLETCVHAVRDCQEARELWKRLVKGFWEEFFDCDCRTWVLKNLSNDWGMRRNQMWKVVFGVTAWCLWKRRNDCIFNPNADMSGNLYLQICMRIDEVSNMQAMLSASGARKDRFQEIQVGWVPPRNDWVKCNVDGACRDMGRFAGCGGVLRDAAGSWISGFSKFLGSCSSVMAELWGLVEGLRTAWRLGFRKVWFEMDSRTAVEMVNRGCSSSHPCFGLVNEARRLMQKQWRIKLSHAFREANFVADWLAGWAIRSRSVLVFDYPPIGCRQFFVADMVGTCFPRWVAV